MSHQFSFLQVFVGYDSVLSHLLTSLGRSRKLKVLPVGSVIGRLLPYETMLLADRSKFQTQICQRFIFFHQMSLYGSVLGRAALVDKEFNLIVTRLELLNNWYIQRLNKFLSMPKSNPKHSDIYYNYIVIWLCNKLLQKIWLLKRQRVSSWKSLQLNLERLQCWRVECNKCDRQSFKFLHAHD
ncbi:MAG: hypothetical protein AAF915_18255 [Cyanobacteria bacterium P01_D01_bin.50]